MPRVAAQDRQTLRLADIARLLNVTSGRASQLANGEDFPEPVLAGRHRK